MKASPGTSFRFSNNFSHPILSLSNIRRDLYHQSFVKQHNKFLCIGWAMKRLTWRNWTLQSDWRALYRPRGTNRCMALLPDPFSIFPKGVWARDYLASSRWPSYTPSIEHVVGWTVHATALKRVHTVVVLKKLMQHFAVFSECTIWSCLKDCGGVHHQGTYPSM